MKILCVIPARLQSTRLPRKMLQEIQGQPMIQMTYLRAKECPIIDQIVVATDNQDIRSAVEEVGGIAVMTDSNLKTGSDRVASIASEYSDVNVVINLQGDEPFIRPEMLTMLVQPYLNGENPVMATLAYELNNMDEYRDPNVVKVILDQQDYAIYFSRSPLPYLRQGSTPAALHHMGLYAYQREFLLQYTQLPQTPLEKAELLEQLRAIEHGYKIKVSKTMHQTLEINTPEELERAQYFSVEVA